MKPPHIWIVVADGETARIFSAHGRTAKLEPAIPYELRMVNPPSREQGTERPGRGHESVGQLRHGVQPRVDPHREAKRTFAEEIAELLHGKTRERAFDELILAAPPKMLGDLRDALDDKTRALVKAELHKDLTKLSPAELHAYLTVELWR
ncbi:host attachment protein [Parvibaculum sp.]|uniref:host attachment protein n=1 Tax=Parvibaculum sp. TaxID=2024848 RepID=UPI00320C692A